MSKAIKIAVSGASGKMGVEIINLINNNKKIVIKKPPCFTMAFLLHGYIIEFSKPTRHTSCVYR